MNFLRAAYIATWLIHIAYVVWLGRGYARLRDEIRELEKVADEQKNTAA